MIQIFIKRVFEVLEENHHGKVKIQAIMKDKLRNLNKEEHF